MTKFCKKCNYIKETNEFNKSSYTTDGYRNECRMCQKEYQRTYRMNNKDKLKEKNKEYLENNKDKIINYLKSDRRKEVKKKTYYKNIENVKNKSKSYYEKNKEEIKLKNKQYRDSIKESDEYKNKRREYNKKWLINNKHISSWRKLLYRALKYTNQEKNNKTIDILKYSPIDLKNHLESLFLEGMSWDNYGEWHIDHIIPLSKFNKDTPIHIINSLDNLQPLWAIDNLIKSNK